MIRIRQDEKSSVAEPIMRDGWEERLAEFIGHPPLGNRVPILSRLGNDAFGQLTRIFILLRTFLPQLFLLLFNPAE